MSADTIEIRRYATDEEARAGARIMSESEPWISYGRTFEKTYANVTNSACESYVAVERERVVGILILCIDAPLLRGYIATVAVHPSCRNRGLGTRLVRFAEERIGKVSPNVFLCVTSFNTEAQRLYRRLGFEQVGEIRDFIVPGVSEVLMRKTSGPWQTFTPPSPR